MADNMMRIAGRGIDGTAKALQTDNNGILMQKSASTVIGKNMYNPATSTVGKIINPITGAVATSSGWVITALTEVGKTISQYISFNSLETSSQAGVAFYDEAKVYISGKTNAEIIADGYKVAIPDGAKYFRATTSSSATQWQIEYGEAPSDYEPHWESLFDDVAKRWILGETKNVYAPQVDVFDTPVASKNLFYRPAAIAGKTIDPATGAQGTSVGWLATPHIEIVNNDSDFVSFNTLTSSASAGTAFYTANKKYISGKSNATIISEGMRIAIPNGAKYFRASTSGDLATINWQIEFSDKSTAYEDPWVSTRDRLMENWIKSVNKFAPKVTTNADPRLDPYTKIIDRERYQVYRADNGLKAIYKDVAVKYHSSSLHISTTGINGDFIYCVAFNATNFPVLISGSKVNDVYIIPFTRNLTTNQLGSSWRLVVVTDKGQVYHNFPSRSTTSDGAAIDGDITKFEESVIWDLPNRLRPSLNHDAVSPEIYFPVLPADRYVHHPLLNTDVSYVDTYGNGGFGATITHGAKTFPRFFPAGMNVGQNSFLTMGGFVPGDKLTLLGTYISNTQGIGGRVCIFATHDGGRTWYNKYEFAVNGNSWSANIDTTGITGDYTSGSFVFHKRALVVPSAEAKEPTNLFEVGSPISVTSVSKASPAVVTASTEHGLSTGNVVVFKRSGEYANNSPDYEWMCNEDFSATSGGNGIVFIVNVINATMFSLREYVQSAFNNLPCRHIHHINRVKDGWIVGTGEEYPQGWQMFIQLDYADSFNVIRAYDDLKIYRLNSASTGVQRTLGVLMLDNADNTLIVAEDTSLVTRTAITPPTGRTFAVSRNSCGVFRGKLSEVDEFDKFECIFEAREPAYFFKELSGAWIFVGQRGEFAISLDKGITWHRETLPNMIQYYYGSSNNIHLIDNYLVVVL